MINITYQEQLLLDALREKKGLNTFEMRQLDFCSPARIVCSLRDKGYVIETELRPAYSFAKRLHHRVAHYFLVGDDNE